MKRTQRFNRHDVTLQTRADGTMLFRSAAPLGPVVQTTSDWLHHWAGAAPERTFLAERYGAGWREESYGATLEQVRSIAAALLRRGLGPKTPIMILSGNGVDHGLLTLAAQYVGIPTVPVAEQYALIHGAHGRLRHAIELVRPHLVYAVDAAQFAEALALDALDGIEVVASRPTPGVTPFADLLRGGGGGADVDGARAQVGPDSVVKLLMTSGSTDHPKAVMTTHRMMCTNQTQLADALPFLRDRPPRIVDWLPWNHVFGGSHNFNMMLANGGSLFIDDGRPVAGAFARTLENLSLVTGTLCFNVPVGLSMLLGALRADAGLRQRFFEDLDLVFYAGASLPQDIWQGFEQMAMEVKGEVPLITSSWGMTETAPCVMMQQEPIGTSGVVGVPVGGATVKLIPDDDMRCEVRVKGPNLMPGYFEAPDQTAKALDAEGFFITGDAMRFVDPSDPNKGMRFDGRISEDFKLLTGTWVRAAQLRIDMLAALAPLAVDLVITGADRDQIGVMIFPDLAALTAQGFALEDDQGAYRCPLLLGEIHRRLAAHAATGVSSSARVARAMVLSEPMSMPEGEMTAKGNLNPRRVLTRRAGLLARLYTDTDPAVTTL